MLSRHRQGGLTLISLLFFAVLIGFTALVVMKLFPLYNERFKVVAAMKAVAGMPNIRDQSTQDIKKFILRNFEVSDVDRFSEQNIGKVLKVTRKPSGGGRVLNMTYEIRGPLFADLDIVMNFNQSIDIAGAGLGDE